MLGVGSKPGQHLAGLEREGQALTLLLKAGEGRPCDLAGVGPAGVRGPVALSSPGLLDKLVEMNGALEEIQKSLDMYLETKRHIFPRFYFLSNDDLLEILGQSRNPEAVQPHLKKCFDNIKSLKIQKVRSQPQAQPPPALCRAPGPSPHSTPRSWLSPNLGAAIWLPQSPRTFHPERGFSFASV